MNIYIYVNIYMQKCVLKSLEIFTILEVGKYTIFSKTIKVLSLAVSSSILYQNITQN